MYLYYPQDKLAIDFIRKNYGCRSITHAVKTALRIVTSPEFSTKIDSSPDTGDFHSVLIRLGLVERERLEIAAQRFGGCSMARAVRLAIRSVAMLPVSAEGKLQAYEALLGHGRY
jgi:hypothetical protein